MMVMVRQSAQTFFLILAAMVFMGLGSTDGLAQASSQQKETTEAEKSVSQDTTRAQSTGAPRDNLKIFLDKIEIQGRIEKPQTVFILPGKDPAVDGIHIDRSFFKEIFRSMEKDDIIRRHRQSPR